MVQIVEGPNGERVEFPDGTPIAAMENAMRSMSSDPAPWRDPANRGRTRTPGTPQSLRRNTNAGARVRTKYGYGVLQEDGTVIGNGADGEFAVGQEEIIGSDDRATVATPAGVPDLKPAPARSIGQIFGDVREETLATSLPAALARLAPDGQVGDPVNPRVDRRSEKRRRAAREGMLSDDNERVLGVPAKSDGFMDQLLAGLTPNPNYRPQPRVLLDDVNPLEDGAQPLRVDGAASTLAHLFAAGAGGLAGSVEDPTTILGGAAGQLPKNVANRLATNAAIAGGMDVGAQSADMASGVQEGGFQPARTASTAIAATALQGAFEAAQPRPAAPAAVVPPPAPVPPAQLDGPRPPLALPSPENIPPLRPRPEEPIPPIRTADPVAARRAAAVTEPGTQARMRTETELTRRQRERDAQETYLFDRKKGRGKNAETETVEVNVVGTASDGRPLVQAIGGKGNRWAVDPARLRRRARGDAADDAAAVDPVVFSKQHYDYRGVRVEALGENPRQKGHTLVQSLEDPEVVYSVADTELRALENMRPFADATRNLRTPDIRLGDGAVDAMRAARDGKPREIKGPPARVQLEPPAGGVPRKKPWVASDVVPLDERTPPRYVTPPETQTRRVADDTGKPAYFKRDDAVEYMDQNNLWDTHRMRVDVEGSEGKPGMFVIERDDGKADVDSLPAGPQQTLLEPPRREPGRYPSVPDVNRDRLAANSNVIDPADPRTGADGKPQPRAEEPTVWNGPPRGEDPAFDTTNNNRRPPPEVVIDNTKAKPAADDGLRGRAEDVNEQGRRDVSTMSNEELEAEIAARAAAAKEWDPSSGITRREWKAMTPEERAAAKANPGERMTDVTPAPVKPEGVKPITVQAKPTKPVGPVELGQNRQGAEAAYKGSNGFPPGPKGESAPDLTKTTNDTYGYVSHPNGEGPIAKGRPSRWASPEEADIFLTYMQRAGREGTVTKHPSGKGFAVLETAPKDADAAFDFKTQGNDVVAPTTRVGIPKRPDGPPQGPNVSTITNAPEAPKPKPAAADPAPTPRTAPDASVRDLNTEAAATTRENARATMRRVNDQRRAAGLEPLDESKGNFGVARNPDTPIAPKQDIDPQDLTPVDIAPSTPRERVDVEPNRVPDVSVADLEASVRVAQADYDAALANRVKKPTGAAMAAEDAARAKLDEAGQRLFKALGETPEEPAPARTPETRVPPEQGPRDVDTDRNVPGRGALEPEADPKIARLRVALAKAKADLQKTYLADGDKAARDAGRTLVQKAEARLKAAQNASYPPLPTKPKEGDTLNAVNARIGAIEAEMKALRTQRKGGKIERTVSETSAVETRYQKLERDLHVEEGYRRLLKKQHDQQVINARRASYGKNRLKDTAADTEGLRSFKDFMDDESGALNIFNRNTKPDLDDAETRNKVDAGMADLGSPDALRKAVWDTLSQPWTKEGAKRAVENANNLVQLTRGSSTGFLRMLSRRAKHEITPTTAQTLGDPSLAGKNALQHLADMVGSNYAGTGRVGLRSVQFASDQRFKIMANRTRDLLEGLSEPERLAVREVLVNRTGFHVKDMRNNPVLAKVKATRMDAVMTAADGMKKALDDQLAYLRESGVEVGSVRDYFYRMIDNDMVMKNQKKFIEQAKKAYLASDAERAAADPKHKSMTEGEAESAARKWLNSMIFPSVKSAYGMVDMGGPLSSFTKARVLRGPADDLLRDFYVTDPAKALPVYFSRSSFLAEQTKRFGQNGKKLGAIYEQLRTQMDPDDLRLAMDLVNGARGMALGGEKTASGDAFRGAMSIVQTQGMYRFLMRTLFYQPTEAVNIAMRLNKGPFTAADAFVKQFDQAWGKSMDAREAARLADLIGVAGDAAKQLVLDAHVQGLTGTVKQLGQVGMHASGTPGMTEVGRATALRMGTKAIRHMLDDVVEGSKLKQSALSFFAEYGVDEKAAKQMHAWVKAGEKLDGEARLSRIAEDSDPAADSYRALLHDFALKSIIEPTLADTPHFAKHPMLQGAYAITSFAYAATREVRNRAFIQAFQAMARKDLSAADIGRLTAPLITYMTAYAPLIGFAFYLRSMTFNRKTASEKTMEDWVRGALDAAGVAGTLSPVLNAFLPNTRYEKSTATMFGGDYLTTFADDLDQINKGRQGHPNNSPNTNTQEYNAARASYNAIFGPSAAAAISIAPAIPAPARTGGVMYATSPDASRLFADTVVGPKGEKTNLSPREAARERFRKKRKERSKGSKAAERVRERYKAARER